MMKIKKDGNGKNPTLFFTQLYKKNKQTDYKISTEISNLFKGADLPGKQCQLCYISHWRLQLNQETAVSSVVLCSNPFRRADLPGKQCHVWYII